LPTAIHRRVAALQRGDDPTFVCRLPSGWLVLGESQFLRGYCLLLPDPVVPHLNALRGDARAQFLADMARAGDALLELTGAVRINYEMLGNLEPALHAHLFPRYADEREELRTKPVWFHDWNAGPKFEAGRDDGLLKALRAKLAGG
jgi:diadenosine tetraphosphate (Ap4A) HIT family hydrolase